MKRYLLIIKTDDSQFVQMFDTYHNVCDAYNICKRINSWKCEVYYYDDITGYTRINWK